MSTKDILIEARKLVEKGWCQGYSAIEEKEVCATLAIRRISGHSENSDRAVRAMKLANGIPESSQLYVWNDAPGRTQAEVLAAFDRAIEEAA